MSDFKFSRGQLVEVVHSYADNTGKRFVVTDSKLGKTIVSAGRELNIYLSPLKGSIVGRPAWCHEVHLKLVDPDRGSLSEYTFEELVLKLNDEVTV